MRAKQSLVRDFGHAVYNYAHIGNLRTYIFEDILKRTLLLNKFPVKHVMNITDVGHLTSDADSGEDKMLKGAKREKKTVWEIAEFYTDAFKQDLRKLNIIKPTHWCKATDYIREQVAMIEQLEKKGFTYAAGGNVYFDTSKLDDYGKLARLDRTKEGKARVEKDKNKKNPHDFVLWFTKSKFQDQEMKWQSPFGVGYPGWHLECSAMATKFLGEQFDIHCGGIDHIPVHHTNEIAQSEATIGKKPWVNIWMHGEFLVIGKGEKMAKSGNNFLTIKVLEENDFSALDYRYFCLGTHYRNPLMFSWDALKGAQNARKKLHDKILEIQDKQGPNHKETVNIYARRFANEINDDLNTSKALATLWEMLKDDNLSNKDKYLLALEFDKVLGLDLGNIKPLKVPAAVIKLAQERDVARKNKDWKKSDELRDKIATKGFIVEDGKDGFEIKGK